MFFLGAVGLDQAAADKGKESYLPGQMIIQLRASGPGQASRAVSSLEADFSITGLKMEKVLSARLGIYLFSFAPARAISDHALLDEVKQHGHVLEAQFNHYVELRETEPDDPNFPDQWALKNTGQLLGVIDADIDATDAWDIATGGLTTLGDTIIIAIIDDGYICSRLLNFGQGGIDIRRNRLGPLHFWKAGIALAVDGDNLGLTASQ